MDISFFSKYQVVSELVTKDSQRVNPCYEIAKLFVIELNKTAGQPYVTKSGKKGTSIFYDEILVLKDLKKLKISNDVHKANSFFADCEKSTIGFRRYYCWKIK